MSRTHHHKKGDCSAIKKNKAGCKSIPRKEWREGKLMNRYTRRVTLLEEIRISI